MKTTHLWQLPAMYANTNRFMAIAWQCSNVNGTRVLKTGAVLSAWTRNQGSALAKHNARKMTSAHFAYKYLLNKDKSKLRRMKRRDQELGLNLLQTGKSRLKSPSRVTLSRESLSTKNRSVWKRLVSKSTGLRSLKSTRTPIQEPDLSLMGDKLLKNKRLNICCKNYQLVSKKTNELRWKDLPFVVLLTVFKLFTKSKFKFKT